MISLLKVILIEMSFINFIFTTNGYKKLVNEEIGNKIVDTEKIKFEETYRVAEKEKEQSATTSLLNTNDFYSDKDYSLKIAIQDFQKCFTENLCLVKSKNCKPKSYLICITSNIFRKYIEKERKFEIHYYLNRIYLAEVFKTGSRILRKDRIEDLLSLSSNDYAREDELAKKKIKIHFIGLIDKKESFNLYSLTYSRREKNPKINGEDEVNSSFNLFNEIEFKYSLKIRRLNLKSNPNGKMNFRVYLDESSLSVFRKTGLEKSNKQKLSKKQKPYEFEMKYIGYDIINIFKDFESGYGRAEESPYKYYDCEGTKFSEENIDEKEQRNFLCFHEGIDLTKNGIFG